MSFLDLKTKNLSADLASGAVSGLVAIPDAPAGVGSSEVLTTLPIHELLMDASIQMEVLL